MQECDDLSSRPLSLLCHPKHTVLTPKNIQNGRNGQQKDALLVLSPSQNLLLILK